MAGQGARGDLSADIVALWFNVNRRGGMNAPHTHDSDISGVYYVSNGSSLDSQLCLRDPRVQAGVGGPAEWTMGMGATMCVEAKPGTVALFPSWLDHYVLTHNSDEPRLSISFNVKVVYPGYHPTSSEVPSDYGLHVHTPERHREGSTPSGQANQKQRNDL